MIKTIVGSLVAGTLVIAAFALPDIKLKSTTIKSTMLYPAGTSTAIVGLGGDQNLYYWDSSVEPYGAWRHYSTGSTTPGLQ